MSAEDRKRFIEQLEYIAKAIDQVEMDTIAAQTQLSMWLLTFLDQSHFSTIFVDLELLKEQS